MIPNIVNKFGTLIGWKAITFNLMGRDVEGITEIEYEDEMVVENEYGAGNMPIGEAEGNYSAKGSMSLHVEEHIAILQSLPKGTRIQEVKIPAIPVIYALNGVMTKDILNNVRITGNARSMKQGDGKIVMKFPIKISHIDWNA
jgi:hypothetical protein